MHSPLVPFFRLLVLNDIAKKALEQFSGVANLSKDADGPHAIIVRSAKVHIDQYPDLLAVARAGTGVDNIVTIENATARGIPVFFAPGANANSVNELFAALVGLYARNIVEAIRFVRGIDPALSNDEIHKLVEAEKKRFKGFELSERTLGVIGLGNIGKMVARTALDRGMSVFGYDPHLSDAAWCEIDGAVQRAASLQQLVRRADIVTVHTDLNGSSRGIVGPELIASMKSGAVLVNLAREPVCDEDAVLAALERKHLAQYITDFPTQRTLTHPQVICTPHLGASTEDAEERSGIMAAQTLAAYLRSGVVENSVNFPAMDEEPREGVRMRLAIPHRNLPDVIGTISHTLGKNGINIGALHNVTKQELGYMVVDLEHPADDAQLEPIRSLENVLSLRVLRF
jgi:D-3-phosphoglycerate dehydrogenase / 2-oxoglutarate reductase